MTPDPCPFFLPLFWLGCGLAVASCIYNRTPHQCHCYSASLAQVTEWVDAKFQTVLAMAGERPGRLLAFDDAMDTSWTATMQIYTRSGMPRQPNTNTSTLHGMMAFRNKAAITAAASNWVVVTLDTNFTTASDLLHWEQSSSSW